MQRGVDSPHQSLYGTDGTAAGVAMTDAELAQDSRKRARATALQVSPRIILPSGVALLSSSSITLPRRASCGVWLQGIHAPLSTAPLAVNPTANMAAAAAAPTSFGTRLDGQLGPSLVSSPRCFVPTSL